MKTTTLLVLLGSLAAAAPFDSGAATFSVPFVKRYSTGNRLLSKRHFTEPLINQVLSYEAELEVGTPGQKVQAVLDTGSADLWLHTKGKEFAYHPNASSTYEFVSDDFEIQYVFGNVSGNWAKDKVKVGPAMVDKLQFGAASNASAAEHGMLGIGFAGVEQTDHKYPNFPQSLKDQGLIKANKYSLFLDSRDADRGQVLFGGVDHSKYHGNLITVPLTSQKSFSVDVKVQRESFNAVLDSGTSFTYVPKALANKLINATNAKYSEEYQVYVVDQEPKHGLTFELGSAKINLPPHELAIPLKQVGGKGDQLVLSVQPNTEFQGRSVLGDSFLRASYVVFDLDNHKVQVAPAAYGHKKRPNVSES